MSTGPDAFSDEVDAIVVSIFAVSETVALATPPGRPISATVPTMAVAVAAFSPIDWIVMELAPANEPLTVVVVCPETVANASIAVIAIPPPAPPGACESARFVAADRTVTDAGTAKVMLPVAVTFASVERPLVTRDTVRPFAPAPVATLIVSDEKSYV